MKYRLNQGVTLEMLEDYDFKINDCGNYELETTYCGNRCEVTILEYDNKYNVVAYYEDNDLGFIQCNPAHIRKIKDLIMESYIVRSE